MSCPSPDVVKLAYRTPRFITVFPVVYGALFYVVLIVIQIKAMNIAEHGLKNGCGFALIIFH